MSTMSFSSSRFPSTSTEGLEILLLQAGGPPQRQPANHQRHAKEHRRPQQKLLIVAVEAGNQIEMTNDFIVQDHRRDIFEGIKIQAMDRLTIRHGLL